jgi:hypothetical protein
MEERAPSFAYPTIYAPLRNTVFTSLEELQHAIVVHFATLNNKPYKNAVYRRLYFYE